MPVTTPQRGRLITLEGGEGAGKSTLLRGLEEHLRAQGVDLVVTREPGGTDVGEAVRGVVLDAANNELCAEAELLLMFASRAQLVRQVIEPALAAGRWVLCDRFTDASFAYQGGGRGQPQARIEELEAWAALGLKPDITLLLDLPVSIGRARAAGRGEADRIEVEGDSFFERVRGTYRARAAAEPARFRVLDASATPDAVLAQAIDGVAGLFAGAVS
ncbi:dTMP kinase [Luteibacter sp. HA06]|jgi:dTMP kinase